MPTNIEGLKRLVLDLWRLAPLALLGIGCYFLSLYLSNLWRVADSLLWLAPEGIDSHTLALRLFQFSAMAMMGIYCTIVACLARTLLARLVWWILAIAELFSVVEYVICKMVADHHTTELLSRLWEIEGQSSACERLAGPVGAYLAPSITTLVLCWILWRAYQVWRNTTLKPTGG